MRLANVAAEEEDWRRAATNPAIVALVSLWSALVESDPAPFDWLPGAHEAVAWLNTEEAQAWASSLGAPLYGAPACVVREVHDKAFAVRASRALALDHADFAPCPTIVSPELLADHERAVAVLTEAIASWPERFRASFTLKPRFGTSGRGRVAGRDGEVDTPQLRAGFARLAARGGAVLEPWLARRTDLSVQLFVTRDGEIRLVSSPELVVSASGVYRGHRGDLDARGRATSGSRFDEPMREAAVALARAAAERGYSGPCSVDGFTYEDGGRERLRPAVELNARFTTGVVVAGLLRMHLREIRRRTGLAPGEVRSFYFGLDAPRSGWPDDRSGLVPLLEWDAEDDAVARPAILVARTRDELDAWLRAGAS